VFQGSLVSLITDISFSGLSLFSAPVRGRSLTNYKKINGKEKDMANKPYEFRMFIPCVRCDQLTTISMGCTPGFPHDEIENAGLLPAEGHCQGGYYCNQCSDGFEELIQLLAGIKEAWKKRNHKELIGLLKADSERSRRV